MGRILHRKQRYLMEKVAFFASGGVRREKETVSNDKSKPNTEPHKEQRFLRGLIFLAAGAFLLLRFAAADRNPFFLGAMWLIGLVALFALIFLLWRVYSQD